MVTITVKDSETKQEMLLSINRDNDETATVKIKFNPFYSSTNLYAGNQMIDRKILYN